MTGLFVTIDGPGGVGKSTVTPLVAGALRDDGATVLQTREPSDTPLGQMARQGTELYHGVAMACLIAADRYAHLEDEIRPALARGETVVCDRYLASSLVLQVLDGVDRDMVMDLNRLADLPDLAVIVNARTRVLDERLARRGAHSRFERQPGSSERECLAYSEAATFLMGLGVRVLQLDASESAPDEVARAIVGAIREPWTKGSA